ncbi:hypothetical protein ACQRBF_04160 [Peptoniphilaceae bacterium SGI.131]
MKKLVFILLFIISILLIFISTKINKTEKVPEITLESAKEDVKKALKLNNIKEDKENKGLIVSSNKHRTILVKDDSYIYIDHTQNPAKLYQFKTQAELVEVTVLEITKDGYRVRHGDHEDFIEGQPKDGVKVGDRIKVPDPHTHLSHIDEDFSGSVEKHDHDSHSHQEGPEDDKGFFHDIVEGISEYFSELRELLKN